MGKKGKRYSPQREQQSGKTNAVFRLFLTAVAYQLRQRFEPLFMHVQFAVEPQKQYK